MQYFIIFEQQKLTRFKYVTGYWKTDHNVTLGQLHFIGPANSHTHALMYYWAKLTGLLF